MVLDDDLDPQPTGAAPADWRPALPELICLASGIALVLGSGLISLTDQPSARWVFVQSLALNVGTALALVGVLARVSRDIVARLDAARRVSEQLLDEAALRSGSSLRPTPDTSARPQPDSSQSWTLWRALANDVLALSGARGTQPDNSGPRSGKAGRKVHPQAATAASGDSKPRTAGTSATHAARDTALRLMRDPLVRGAAAAAVLAVAGLVWASTQDEAPTVAPPKTVEPQIDRLSVTAEAFDMSEDGRTAYVASSGRGSALPGLFAYNLSTQQRIWSLPLPNALDVAVPSSNLAFVQVTGIEDGSTTGDIAMVNLSERRILRVLSLPVSIRELGASQDGEWVLVTGASRESGVPVLMVLNAVTGRVHASITGSSETASFQVVDEGARAFELRREPQNDVVELSVPGLLRLGSINLHGHSSSDVAWLADGTAYAFEYGPCCEWVRLTTMQQRTNRASSTVFNDWGRAKVVLAIPERGVALVTVEEGTDLIPVWNDTGFTSRPIRPDYYVTRYLDSHATTGGGVLLAVAPTVDGSFERFSLIEIDWRHRQVVSVIGLG